MQNRRKGAAVLLQHNKSRRRKMPAEQSEGRAGGATKTVDGLIGIADCEDVCSGTTEERQDLDLGEVRILKFVDQQKAGAGLLFGEQPGIAFQQLIGTRDHVSERAEVSFAEHAFDGGEDACDFAAAAENF